MASNEEKIPTIEFSKPELKPGTTQWDSTRSQVFQALQEYGFFKAILNDKLPTDTKESMFGSIKEISEFPLETKLKNLSKKPLHGYIGQSQHIPLYEGVCIDDLLQPGNVENFANIFWPDGNPDFCNLVTSYSKPLLELDEMVKTMVLESLGLNNYINEFLDLMFFNLRLAHYKAPQGNKDGNKAGMTGHSDGNFLTIISQNQINGLQIAKKNGDWIDVDISPNSVVVLSGDSFVAWTNGRLHSPFHKVAHVGDIDRISIQLFALPKLDYSIEAPKELVDEEHPLLFKPYKILGFYEYITEGAGAGRKVFPGALEDYCGV